MIKNILFFFIFSITSLMSAELTRIMLLGDSITYDYIFDDDINPRPQSIRSGYRNYLWYQLQNAKYNVDFVGSQEAGTAIIPSFDPDNEGYPGATSYQIAHVVYDKLVANPADIILLHIGTNDWNENIYGIENILEEIDLYENNYNHPITVILARIINSPLNYTFIHSLNTNIQNLADSRIQNGDNIVVVDMEYGAGIDYRTDFQDSLHPNNAGYAKMANIWFNALTNILDTTNLPNPLLKPFVERFYNKILLRQGEEAGINYWVDALSSNSLSAADLARSFIESDEFKNQNTDNTEFLEILYQAFFNRNSDSAGLNYWLDQFEKGTSRFSILNGFLYSQEFNTLAQSYNILAVAPAELFVTRFYTKALERDPEKEGLRNWVNQLRTYKTTASGIAKAFFFSNEFIAKNVSNEKYLKLLYRTLLDREADSGGLERWQLKLDEGLSRENVLNSFIYSSEFKTLAYVYKIKL